MQYFTILKHKIGIFIMLLFSASQGFSQNISPANSTLPDPPFMKNQTAVFHRLESTGTSQAAPSASQKNSDKSFKFNYRLSKGDKTEILEYKERKWTSIKKEVLNDTLMPNGIKYKIIEYRSLSNSSDHHPEYEYQRVDTSGNVWTYYNNEDKLLYDFSKNIGDEFPSPYPGKSWKVRDFYRVIGFGDTLKAVDLELRDIYSYPLMIVTIAEKYGLIALNGMPDQSTSLIEQHFWGAIFDNKSYGELLALENNTDWTEYYPLNIGNFWKYRQYNAGYFTTEYNEVIKDTVLYDGNSYRKIKTQTFMDTHPYYTSIKYERLDSSGNIFGYPGIKNSIGLRYRLSTSVGDTFYVANNSYSYYRVAEKFGTYDSLMKKDTYAILISLQNAAANYDLYFMKGLGIKYIRTEGTGGPQGLTGAIIDGVMYGDTTYITGVNDEAPVAEKYALLQNYPNPFNPVTTIEFRLPESGYMTLKVYDMLGREVARLADGYWNSGSHSVTFDAARLSSGTYFYEIRCNNIREVKKMLLIK